MWYSSGYWCVLQGSSGMNSKCCSGGLLSSIILCPLESVLSVMLSGTLASNFRHGNTANFLTMTAVSWTYFKSKAFSVPEMANMAVQREEKWAKCIALGSSER